MSKLNVPVFPFCDKEKVKFTIKFSPGNIVMFSASHINSPVGVEAVIFNAAVGCCPVLVNLTEQLAVCPSLSAPQDIVEGKETRSGGVFTLL